MTLAQLRRLRRVTVAMQHATGVFCAFAALLSLSGEKYVGALVCVIGFGLVMKQRVPEIPPDE